jgi:hypothetical protein
MIAGVRGYTGLLPGGRRDVFPSGYLRSSVVRKHGYLTLRFAAALVCPPVDSVTGT